MNDSVITAFAALAGAAIGGLMSVVASYLTQRTQGRQQWILQERHRRQELYREFVEEASKCYPRPPARRGGHFTTGHHVHQDRTHACFVFTSRHRQCGAGWAADSGRLP